MNFDEIRDWKWYRGNLSWLKDGTIFLTRHGSQAYGTSRPESDLDIKGIAIAPVACYLGNLNHFEQAEVHEPIDGVIYDIRKFFKLAWDCNPNIIEMLFTDESDWIIPHKKAWMASWEPHYQTWDRIHRNREHFLSRKAAYTFSGYAVAQMKRIRSHRKWLLNPPKAAPVREDFGLKSGQATLGKEQLGVLFAEMRKIQDTLGGTGLTKDEIEDDEVMYDNVVRRSCSKVNVGMNLVEVVKAEHRFANACRTWSQYQTWKTERNPVRQELEAKYGYDTKHGMHLVRLMRMAHEILGTGKVWVRRPDAAELLEIRNGAWSFDQLEEWAADMESSIPRYKENSPLPHEPDRKYLDSLLVDIIQETL